MYNTIFFDLDGTIIDSSEGILNCVVYALNKLGIQVEDKSSLLCFIGPPLTYSFNKYCGLEGEAVTQAVEYYRERYSTKGMYEVEVYAGVEVMLKALKDSGKRLFIATSKPEFFSNEILKNIGLRHYFDGVCGATMDHTRNTKEEVLRCAISCAKLDDLNSAVMVGDRHHDIDGAGAVGMDSIGVRYGFAPEGELEAAGATYVVDTPRAVCELIGNIG